MGERPKNVILFLTDQQRKDTLGAYGNSFAKTPNLDRLAAEGVRFDRAYCQSPFCSPSRASILTGLYQRTHGVWYNQIPFDRIGAPTIADMLHRHGYQTGSVGKIHLGANFGPAPSAGFEESRDYWDMHPQMRDWHGPYCGFHYVDLTLGHVHYATTHGHYGAYLAQHFPEGVDLLKRERAQLNQGFFETWRNAMPEEHHYNAWIADRTIDMIDRSGDQPFFIHCSFPDPHHPLSACAPYSSLHDPADMPEPIALLPGELDQMPPVYADYHLGRENYYATPPSFPDKIAGEPLREMMAQMHGMVSHVDHSIGRVVEHLRARGLLEQTLIIFTSDHGELMGDHGLIMKGPFYYQSLLNVPLIAHGPGLEPGAHADLVAHVDLAPTILDCLGLPIPAYLPGRSLKATLHGEVPDPRDAVLTEFRPFKGPNMKVLHTDRWKYVYYAGEPWGELFDLEDDPQEHHNLFGDQAHRRVQEEMHARLLDELVQTEAPWPTVNSAQLT